MPLLDPFLAEILRCPCPHHADLTQDEAASQLECAKCRLRFAVRDDIPNMLLEEAIVPPDFDPQTCGAPELLTRADA